jgi:aminoglycoside phosphotransferase (APT) family kinase protein
VVDDAGLDALAGRLGSRLVAWSAVGWGDSRATRRLALADGRVVAARRIAGPTALGDARRIATVMWRLAEGGLPIPRPVLIEDHGPAAWLVTPWVDGETGAAWLDRPDRARHLAGRLGGLAARLLAADATGIGLDTAAVTDRDLAELRRRQLDTVALEPATRRMVAAQLDHLAAERERRPVFVHGDFAPINVVVDAEGEVAALLDFEHARFGPPGADAAWWGWVVRHHHRAAWTASWRTFCAAAGIDADREAGRLEALVLSELLDRAATAADRSTRSRWLERLEQTASELGGDRAADLQAT